MSSCTSCCRFISSASDRKRSSSRWFLSGGHGESGKQGKQGEHVENGEHGKHGENGECMI